MKKLFLASAFTILYVFVCNAQSKTFNLNKEFSKDYKEISIPKNNYSSRFENALRIRELGINPAIQDARSATINDTILLDLFNDDKYKAVIKKVGVDVNGTNSILAQLTNCDNGYFVIATSNDKSLITIDIPEKNELFVSRYIEEKNQYYLVQIDRSKEKILDDGEPLQADSKGAKHGKNRSTVPNDSMIQKDQTSQDTITMMIVYTQAAATWASSNEAGINNTISSLMLKSQMALDNSKLFLNLQLVHSEQVDYNEVDGSSDLRNLADSTDGFMDNVHALRNLYRADVVVLLENTNSNGGLAYLFADDPAYAFSYNRVQQASIAYTTIHEIGHNLGCGHHYQQNSFPGPGFFPYSSGWRWTGTDSQNYCDLMTYADGSYFADGITHTNVPYFSNPDILYKGVPTGDYTLADNSRTIRETKSRVAAYRSGHVSPPPAPKSLDPSDISVTGFTANWDPSPTADGYILDVAEDIGFNSFVFKNLNVKNITTIDLTGLNAKTQYFYRVKAYNTGGKSAYSGIKKVTTFTKPSSIPLNLTAKSCDNIITLRWQKSTGPDFLRYIVVWGDNSNVTVTKTDSTSDDISDTVKVFSGLKKGQTYYFKVKAVNYDRQMSLFSNKLTSTVKVGIIPKIRIKWGDILICSNLGDSIKSFQWYSGGSIISQAVSQYFVTKKIKGTYNVQITDKDGCTHFSNSISVSDTKSLSLYPNPATQGITIQMDGLTDGKAVVRILNSYGAKVLEFQTEIENGVLLQKLPVTDLKPGTYIVSVFINQNELCSSQILVVK